MDTTQMMKIGELFEANTESESPIETRMISEMRKYGLRPRQQVEIGRYRVDILLETKYQKIVIECDGKEFHLDKERDRIRDLYLHSLGYVVLRFTGVQIYKESFGCIKAIVEYISEIYSTKEWQEFAYKSDYNEEEDIYQFYQEEDEAD